MRQIFPQLALAVSNPEVASSEAKFGQARGDGQQDRALAARGLAAVLRHGRTLDQFEKTQPLTPLATELLYGSCRHYYSLAAQLQPLLREPIRKKDQEVWALLIVGAYQLTHTRIPDHAAIATTVAAAAQLRQPWAKGLVNGCLRTLQRQAASSIAAAADLPGPLNQLLERAYPAQAQALRSALNQRAPLSLRVNTTKQSVAAYRAQLGAAGLGYRQGHAAETLILETPVPAATLPGYADGAVAVQDAGAQLALNAMLQLLPAAPGRSIRVLDACAAPGGKLFHLLEQALGRGIEMTITAVEHSTPRLSYLRAEAERLGHAQRPELQLLAGDACGQEWWDGTGFDLILLDAPCSGSGTLRRHPEIKLLRTFAELDADIALQNRLLKNLLPMRKPGGHLLYATCSILPAENDARIRTALRAQPGLASAPLSLPSGAATEHGWQLLPTDPDTDGFYYAALVNLE